MDRIEYLRAKQYQIELLLIGFALGSKTAGARDHIADMAKEVDLVGARTQEVLDAIADRRVDLVKAYFEAHWRLMIPSGEMVIDCLLRHLKEQYQEKLALSEMAVALRAGNPDNVDEVRKQLERALEALPSANGEEYEDV